MKLIRGKDHAGVSGYRDDSCLEHTATGRSSARELEVGRHIEAGTVWSRLEHEVSRESIYGSESFGIMI